MHCAISYPLHDTSLILLQIFAQKWHVSHCVFYLQFQRCMFHIKKVVQKTGLSFSSLGRIVIAWWIAALFISTLSSINSCICIFPFYLLVLFSCISELDNLPFIVHVAVMFVVLLVILISSFFCVYLLIILYVVLIILN